MKTLMVVFLCLASAVAVATLAYVILDIVRTCKKSGVTGSSAIDWAKMSAAERAAKRRQNQKEKAAKRAQKLRAARRVKNKMTR